MRPRRTVPAAFLVLLVLTSVAGIPIVDARQPPTPVCGVCSVEQVAPDGTTISGESSTLTVSIHENGSTTWEARVTLASGRDVLATNESLRQAVVAEGTGRGIATPTEVHSRIDGDTLVVNYRDATATESHVGTVVFTPLTPDGPDRPLAMGGEGPRYLGTDRLTLRAPSGYELRGDGTTTEAGQNLVWTRGSERRNLDVTDDPVAIEADSMMPGTRMWLARSLS